ncbi:hypothetical protein QVD17_15488 [Tagetes erecta]|uniref:NAD(P)-binding domain-containing protein n=1 Tax=Tagetes erecta TaxID=13708 RepID=A0AAD8KPX5_TARER|nr:hypothetical protein QVD17_15488 [Tagetes erecta]
MALLRRSVSSLTPLSARLLSGQRSFNHHCGGTFFIAINHVHKIVSNTSFLVPSIPRCSFSASPALTHPSSDDSLIRVIKSEIKCSEETYEESEDFPEGFPFKVTDKLGQQIVSLTREYQGENICVEVEPSSLVTGDEDSDSDNDVKDVNQTSQQMVVTICKDVGPSLEFGIIAYADKIVIDSLSVHDPDIDDDQPPYDGPRFDELEESIQKGFYEYLDIRGIKPAFLEDNIQTKSTPTNYALIQSQCNSKLIFNGDFHKLNGSNHTERDDTSIEPIIIPNISLMAPSLTANSFLLTTTPNLRLASLKTRRFVLCAKKPDTDADSENLNSNSFRFNFDFGKVSEMKSLIPTLTNASSSGGTVFGKRKDPNTVFVAGGTGQAGIRIAQTLLREGFSVRAGVPEIGAAQDLARIAVDYKVISTEESKRLNAVESTFENPESIAKAIGNATKAVVTIGQCENGPTAEVTTSEALQLIQGAQLAGVSHVIIIYDTSPLSFTSTNNVLDGISLFFNNLFSKSQPLSLKEFIDGLIATDVKYTLIKAKLADDYVSKSSYNLVVSAEGFIGENDYKVAKSQIASLVADVFSNTEVAENKVVEVTSSPDAAARPVSELFSAIPEDNRRKDYTEAIAKAKAEEAMIAAKKAAELAEKEINKLDSQDDFQEQATAARKSFADLVDRFKTVTKATEKPETTAKDSLDQDPDAAPALALSWENLSSRFASAVKNNPIELPKVQIATVRGQAKARTLPPKKAVVKKPAAAKKVQPKPKESKAEVRKIFGGVFQQETIYVDD